MSVKVRRVGTFMYKGIENEWLKYHDFLILDLLAVQAAYWLSYLFLFWYAGTPDESFLCFICYTGGSKPDHAAIQPYPSAQQ